MTKQEIIDAVKSLNMPLGSFVVFGSGPLAVAGIREAGDVDMLVTPDLLQRFKNEGWTKVVKSSGDEPYTNGHFEAHDNWDFSPYSPTLEHLLKTADIYDGIPFASLPEVRKWKQSSVGEKNLKDVILIDKHLESDQQNV